MAAITAELGDGLQVRVTNGTHAWIADEPVEVGGGDTGPDPYDQLLGALAACTCITLAMYAARNGIELTSVSVEYAHDRIHARDCEQCEDPGQGKISRITSRIFIDGRFDDDTRARLQAIAVNCPIHKTLAAGMVFEETVFAG